MQKAKAFLFVCTGIFLLALSYHLGAANATAQKSTSQAGTTPQIVSTWREMGGREGKEMYVFVVDSNGGVWTRPLQIDVPGFSGKPTRLGRFWEAEGR